MEKAERALNARIEEFQGRLQETSSGSTRNHVVQSIVVCVAISEALEAYTRGIQQYAASRYTVLKEQQATLTSEHAALLKTGQDLLLKLKENPAHPALPKEIEAIQRSMAAIQKSLRRKADTLQKDISPSMRLVDEMATSLCRLCGAGDKRELTRAVLSTVAHVQELYRAHPYLPFRGVVDAFGWENSVQSEMDDAVDFYDAHARAGFQVVLALEVMAMAVSTAPPQTAEEATERAHASVKHRVKAVALRLTQTDKPGPALDGG